MALVLLREQALVMVPVLVQLAPAIRTTYSQLALLASPRRGPRAWSTTNACGFTRTQRALIRVRASTRLCCIAVLLL